MVKPFQPPPLVCIGREKEFNFIAKQFDKPFSATLIYGDPAIGKSEFLRDIEKIYQRPDKVVYVGRWEAAGSEDTILYTLANLLDKIHKGPLKEQANILWSKIRGSFSSLESFNNFVKDLLSALNVPGSELPSFIRKQFKLEIDSIRTPLLNREIFLYIVNKLMESIRGLKIILLIDNLSIGFENKPSPQRVLESFSTLRNILEKIREMRGIHLIVSWKITNNTQLDFQVIKNTFQEYFHQDYKLGPIRDMEIYANWLEEKCNSFRNLNKKDKAKFLGFTSLLPSIGVECIGQEAILKKILTYEELTGIATNVRNCKYKYLLQYLNQPGRESLHEVICQLSVLPFMYGLTLYQIAELVSMPGNNRICYCGLKGEDQKSFIEWQSNCLRNLEQAIEINLLNAVGNSIEDKQFFFEHETKKEYIKELALNTPKKIFYIMRAFDFSINHIGAYTKEYPDISFQLNNVSLLLLQISTTSHKLRDTFNNFIATLATNFFYENLLYETINSKGFCQLPPHLRAIILSEYLKFPNIVNLGKIHNDLSATTKEKLTYFQTLTIARSLVNCTRHYGKLDKLAEMKQCVEWIKELYNEHGTHELALEYVRALVNTTKHYGKLDKLAEMKQCLERSKELYNDCKTFEMALKYARVLVNCTKHYGRLDKLVDMEQSIEWSKELYNEHETPELALKYARALCNASITCKNKNNMCAEIFFKNLKDFLKDKPEVDAALLAVLEKERKQRNHIST